MAARRILCAVLAVLTAAMVAGVAVAVSSSSAGATLGCWTTGKPTVKTDKPDYGPGDTVYITGTGYACGSTVTVKIVPPHNLPTWTKNVAIGSSGKLSTTYQIPATNSVGRYYLSVLNAAGTVLASTTFLDTHFRYGTLSWTRPSLSSRSVGFTVGESFRLGYFTSCLGSQPTVGQYIPPSANSACVIGSLNFGDSSTIQFFGIHVTSVDTTNDILQGFDTLTHTYAGSATSFTAVWNDCCRLSSLANNHDTSWNLQTQVNLDPVNGAVQSPTSILPAMTDCAVGAVCTIPVPVTDNDPKATSFTYRLSTPAEMGDPSETQPPGATIDPNSGVFTWNSASHGGPGTLWNASVMVEARNSAGAIIATTEVDFLIRLVTGVPPVFVSPPSPTSGSTLNATVGNQLTVPLEAKSPTGRTVSIHTVSTISGATLTCPAPATPIDCTYSWTPTLNDTGSHLVSFVAEDSTGAQSSALTITIKVAQVVVTVTPDNQSINYGDPDPAFTFHSSGFLGSDDFTTQPTCGVSGPHSNAGTYMITCSGGVAPTGYQVVYNTATLTVAKLTVTVTPNNQSMTYGDPEPNYTFTSSGFIGTDGFSTPPTCGVNGAHRNVGTYQITCSGADAGGNYTIAYDTAALTVTPRPLTISADNQSTTFGDPDPTFTFSTAGLVPGDSLTTTPSCGVAGPHSNAGTYPITCSGADAGPNYTIGYVDGTLTVSARTVVVTADDQTITYGQPDPAFTFTAGGFQANDTFTTPPTCGVNGPHQNAGSYVITCSGGAASSNYTISYATGTLTVNQKDLVVTADSQSTTYGQPDPAFTFHVSGFVPGDSFVTAPTCGVSGPHRSAGSYPITCSGADAGGNYAIHYVAGMLVVAPATLTITANDQNKLVGAPDPTFTFTVSGLVGSDSLITQPTCGVSGAHNTPGTYLITCSGADAGPNYTIKYVAGRLVVGKASPALNTFPSASVPVGGQISDTAVLVNGASPTGFVTFSLYGPSDPNCTKPIAVLTSKVSAGAATSASEPTRVPGTYNWIASYGGDSQNNPVAGSCGQERVVVTAQQLTGRAYGLTLSARLGTTTLLNVKPTPDTGAVNTTNPTNVGSCVASVPGLLSVRAVCASQTTSPLWLANSVGTASIGAVTIGLSGVPTIVVQAVHAQSATTCEGSTGSTTIAYLKVGTTVLINQPTVVKPNTKITVGVVHLVLDEQTPFSTPDKGLLVNAIHLSVNALGHPVVNAVLASAESDIGNCP